MATGLLPKMVGDRLLAQYYVTNIFSFLSRLFGGMGADGRVAYGGIGYGAGGGAGGYTYFINGGGNGADGLVYIEWD